MEEEMAGLKSADQSCAAGDDLVGNPIRVTTGAKLHREPSGIVVGGQELALSYSSDLAIHAAAAGRSVLALGASPAVGGHWQSSLHRQLHFPGKGLSVQLYRGDVHAVNFRYDQVSKVYVADAGSSYSLSYAAGVYRVVDREGFVETYNAAGKITRYEGIDGNQLTFAYSAAASADAPGAGFLMEVTDQNARAVRFAYDSTGRIVRVVDPSTRELELSYDTNGLLTTIEWPNAQLKTFLYENSSFAHALTGVVDERGTRLSTFTYDGTGRATSTERAGSVNRYEVGYGTPPGVGTQMLTDPTTGYSIRRQGAVAPQGTQVNGPNGQLSDVGAALIDGVARVTSSSQPAGSGCAAASSHKGYDSVGNLIVADNFSGERSCMAYDSLSRLATRIDGLAASVDCASVLPTGSTLPIGARRTDYEWHPDWNLPTKVTQPGRITRTIYEGQPDPTAGNAQANCSAAPQMSHGKPLPLVCKTNVVAVAAPGGSAVVLNTSSTFDRRARLLSHTDEKGRLTQYGYHTENDFPGVGDQFIKDVAILMKGEGTNGSSVFVNSAPHNITAQTAGRNARITTVDAAFGTGSMTFAGTNDFSADYIQVSNAKMASFWASDWTIEARIKPSTLAGATSTMTIFGAWSSSVGATINVSASNGKLATFHLSGYEGSSGTLATFGSTNVTNHVAGEWASVAVTKEGTTYRFFVNGVLLHQETRALNLRNFTSNNAWIGSSHSSYYPYPYRGLIDELRVTTNNARYTQNYTLASTEFSALPWNPALYQPDDVGVTPFDLASVTNAAGHVTQYTHYDRAGRVRRMVDAKGVVSEISYTPRGWVSAVVSTPPGGAARTTTYSYDAAGQLTGVVQPDGSTLSYEYDAAQRLVGVSDERGNTISYTLDAMGNRVGEEIKDPGDVLQRSISRSFDALNRLQQVTGAAQ